MAGNILCSVIGAALDGYAFALLIPFLNALFNQPPLPLGRGWVNNFLNATIGALLDPANPMRSLRNVILIILATVTVKNFFVWIAGTLGAQVQEYVTRDLRDAVYRHLQLLPIGYFTRTKTGQIISRVLSDTEQTRTLVTQLVTQAIQSGALVVIYVAYLFGISWRLALVAGPITETLAALITVLLLWVGARAVLVDRTLQASQFLVFLTFVLRLLQPLKQLSQIPAVAQNAFASAERLFDVLDAPTEQALDKGTRVVRGFNDSIVFDDVSFAYEDEPVLSHISFTARKGDVVALVGASGAGKSTLVDLIPRFYEPKSGRILLDGVDTREITLPSLRALTGIVSQETVIFNDTVRNNIAYGRGERLSHDQIEAAARAANAHAFIAELPQGYDTPLGERGARLSGGQRQRIAIARALLVDPPILILDEATSALDTESERLVQEAIDRLLAGRTVFVIAHRLSTVQHATQILVLDRGQ